MHYKHLPLASFVCCWIGCVVGAGAAASSVHPSLMRGLRVGTMTLTRCVKAAAYCGQIDRPLDPAGIVPGRLPVHFEFYPRTGRGRSRGTLVATEGGPGYAATESRDDYLALLAPLREDRDVLIMDNRGTGQSGALDCHDLQTAEKWTIAGVAACGRSLGERASLFSTAYAADDLAAILDALGIEHIDLYGDSYGTYFEQVFASRHGAALRSLVLDGAYPLDDVDYAWYPTYAPAMRAKFNLACARSADCARLPGSSIDHILPALARLRSAPFPARADAGDGRRPAFTVDPGLLATVMFASAPAYASVRELDAAARAFADGDLPPLVRLMAETTLAVDSRDPTANPKIWSAGLAAAVMCQDPPQIYDMRLEPALRASERDRVIRERERTAPDTYAPFTIDEYRSLPLDYSFLDQCVGWPVAPPAHPASRLAVPAPTYPDVPALILAGEFDDITTPAEAAAVAHEFRRGQLVVLANSFHVNALPHARSACGAEIVRRFVATLDPGDVSCASAVPPLRLVGAFTTSLMRVDPATGLPGSKADDSQLRAAATAVLTVGDVLARLVDSSPARGSGLRGGKFQVEVSQTSQRITLHNVRWAEDLAVSGRIVRPRRGNVRAALDVSGRAALSGRLELSWPSAAADALAHIRGTLGGAALDAQVRAP